MKWLLPFHSAHITSATQTTKNNDISHFMQLGANSNINLCDHILIEKPAGTLDFGGGTTTKQVLVVSKRV